MYVSGLRTFLSNFSGKTHDAKSPYHNNKVPMSLKVEKQWIVAAARLPSYYGRARTMDSFTVLCALCLAPRAGLQRFPDGTVAS